MTSKGSGKYVNMTKMAEERTQWRELSEDATPIRMMMTFTVVYSLA